MSAGRTMSSPEPEQREHCPFFSSGNYCPRRRACPLIHSWALFNAAKKENKFLAKPNHSQGDLGVKTYNQVSSDTSFNMGQEKNIKHGNSQTGALVKTRITEKVTMFPPVTKKSQGPVKDGKSSNRGRYRGRNNRKSISEDINHSKPANLMYKMPKTSQMTPSVNLSQSSPILTLDRHAESVARIECHWMQYSDGVDVDPPWDEAQYNMQYYDRIGPSPSWDEAQGNMQYYDRIDQDSSRYRAAGSMQHYDGVGRDPSSDQVMERKLLTEFTIFNQLPFEIRIAIWQISIRRPYNPMVRIHPITDHKGAIVFCSLVCLSMTPIALRINRESRTEGLKHYMLTLDGTTYLNHRSGTVFLESSNPGDLTHFVAAVPQYELQAIKNLAVNVCEWSYMDETFREAMWQFSNIERLMMMFSTSDDEHYLHRVLIDTIRMELRQPRWVENGWMRPSIGLIRSSFIEKFLRHNTFA